MRATTKPAWHYGRCACCERSDVELACGVPDVENGPSPSDVDDEPICVDCAAAMAESENIRQEVMLALLDAHAVTERELREYLL